MKFLRQLSAAAILTCVLTLSALAGEMSTGRTSAGQISTGATAQVAGQMDTGLTSQVAGEMGTGRTSNVSSEPSTDSLTTTILNMLGNLLRLF